MKRLLALIFVLTLLVITGTLVSADGQNSVPNNEFSYLDKQFQTEAK
jgi:hypothetical protein